MGPRKGVNGRQSIGRAKLVLGGNELESECEEKKRDVSEGYRD